MLQIYIFPLKPQKKFPKNLHKKEIFLIFAADLKHNLFKFSLCDISKTFKTEAPSAIRNPQAARPERAEAPSPGYTLGIRAISIAPCKGKSFQSPEYKCDTITAQ